MDESMHGSIDKSVYIYMYTNTVTIFYSIHIAVCASDVVSYGKQLVLETFAK